MTRKEVFNGVQDIFRDIFNEDDMVIEDKTNSDDVEKWDSLNHINLFSCHPSTNLVHVLTFLSIHDMFAAFVI